MSRVKAHPIGRGRHTRSVKLNRAEQEQSRRGKTVALGAMVILLAIVVGIFLAAQ